MTIPKKMKMLTVAVYFLIQCLPATTWAETIGLFYELGIGQHKFAANDIKLALEAKNYTVEVLPLSALAGSYPNKKVVISLMSDKIVSQTIASQGGKIPEGLSEQAYDLQTTTAIANSYWVIGGDANGAMYGALQLAENIGSGGFGGTYNTREAPYMLSRGMKLNMPLDRRIPTYVGGWSATSAQKAIPHVWDMSFWKKLIDQQARNRYNVLSVWVHHPFPALVKLADYPRASLPRIEGFNGYIKELNHEQRVAFWREVMQYAHDRGMKFYFFNWNIYVDYAKDQYPEIKQDQTNPTTIDYMKKSMKALIDTYPELDGFGISAGDGMSSSSQDNTKWTYDAIGSAVTEYLTENPSRKFTLIHRSIYSSPELFKQYYAPLKTVPNATMNYSVKYAQAHMYSTTTPKWTDGIQTCANLGMKTFLTIRNDDYFYINWGDPKFVRDYMAGIPAKQAVVGMYIGSDGYNPSRTYFCKDNDQNGQLEVERRWYMEMLWGRISYNPQISDDVFKNMLAKRFPTVSAGSLFDAWTLASRSLPKVTELIMKDWSLDFHWYPEACWSDPGRGTGFRTIDGFANETSVANGSNLCSIANSAAGKCNGKKSSYEVADEMLENAEKSLSLISSMSNGGDANLKMAITNVKQMALLSGYYAYKIRGATYKKAGQTIKAREAMGSAYCYWKRYSSSMDSTYYGDSFRNLAISPNWKFADAAVLKEYTDLGGTGAPICGSISYKISTSENDASMGQVFGAGIYNPGDDVILKAVPLAGYRFVCWKENNEMVSTDVNYKFTTEKDRNLTAFFINIEACAFPWNDAGITVNKATVNKTLGPIDISCAPNGVSISMNLEGIGADNSDYCRVYYKVDGGVQKPIASLNGAFASKSVSVSGVVGKKLEIIISSATSFSDEFYHITNIRVSEIATSSAHTRIDDDIEIYPNPVSKTLTISLPDDQVNREVKVLDSIGKMVYSTQTKNSKLELDVQALNLIGAIIIQVSCEKLVYSKTVLVER